MTKVVIAGGGLAGCLAALALARRRPQIDLLLIERGAAFGGDHTWSWFDSDIDVQAGWVLAGLRHRRWPDHEVRFPKRSRVLPVGYNSLRSSHLDETVRRELGPDRYRLDASVARLAPRLVELDSGERIAADLVVDARGGGVPAEQDLGWQKFVGRTYRFARAHGVTRPIIMDATVVQHDGYRFVYLLPFSETEMLIEDTYYSLDPRLDRDKVGKRLDDYAAGLSDGRSETLYEESGVLPVVINGDFQGWWPADDPMPRIGVRGGLFHPTTSYSLPDAAATAAYLADEAQLTEDGLAARLRRRAARQWRRRRFYQYLNRMLFRAAEPDEMYRVFEHFYRLPTDVISRFYAARLRPADRLRILCGKPPVRVRRALAAVAGRGQ